MKRIAIAFTILFAYPAFAQAQQPQKYIPFTVEEKDAVDLRKYLDEQPMKFALPILQWMETMEQKAIKANEKAADDKPTEEKPKK
jgi:hypothetical protein